MRSCYANSKNAILIIERRTKEVKEEEETTAKKNGKRKKESLRVSGGFNGAQAKAPQESGPRRPRTEHGSKAKRRHPTAMMRGNSPPNNRVSAVTLMEGLGSRLSGLGLG